MVGLLRGEYVGGQSRGGSGQATVDTRRTKRKTRERELKAKAETILAIEHSLRWHDPDRFNGCDLSPRNAGTPVVKRFAANDRRLSMAIPA
jgi:hypothetical protein